MLVRTKHMNSRYEVFTGYKRIGPGEWLTPRNWRIKRPERLQGITHTVGGNWLRRFVFTFMRPTLLRRRILNNI